MINIYSIRPKGFNIGNDVIYLALNHFIRQAFRENFNVISLPATSKYESHKKSGLSSETVYEINQFGHGVIVGGGNLYENGELEINPVALKALDKPLMIFSVARGKIFNKQLKMVDRTDVMTDEKIILLNKKADVSLSRDKATFEYINSLGINNSLGGCPTLFINEIPQHQVPLMESDKTDALISVRTPSLMSVPVSFQYKVREDILSIIELLRIKGYKNIKILCHDHRDVSFADSFDIDYLYTADVYTFLSYLRNTKLNITYRLHSFIPCLSLDIPTINLSYDQRSISMIETLKIAEWNINILKDNVLAEVENRIDNLDTLTSLKTKLRETVWKELKNIMMNGCERFANLIKSTKNYE
jgi:polysaccharide pyruvyl transferase WcaK-like protein